MWVAVLPSMVNFRSPMVFLLIMSKPQKVKNRWTSAPSPRAALARISPGYAISRLPLEQMIASLRPGRPRSRSWGRSPGWRLCWSCQCVPLCSGVGLDAADRLGQAGDVGHLLRRLLREQAKQRLDRDAADGGHPAQGRGLAHFLEVFAQESDHVPVLVGQRDADLGGQSARESFVPLGRVGEEALFADVDLMAVESGHGHGAVSSYFVVVLLVLPTMDMWVEIGIGRPRSRMFQ